MTTVPYLVCNGNREEAIEFYRSALGGEISIMRFGEMPPSEEMPISDSWKRKIMHGELKLDDKQTLYPREPRLPCPWRSSSGEWSTGV